MTEAQRMLDDMLDKAQLTCKSAYSAAEVCTILQISDQTFYRMAEAWEPSDRPGRDPKGLQSYRISTHYRVPYSALLTWLENNLVDA